MPSMALCNTPLPPETSMGMVPGRTLLLEDVQHPPSVPVRLYSRLPTRLGSQNCCRNPHKECIQSSTFLHTWEISERQR